MESYRLVRSAILIAVGAVVTACGGGGGGGSSDSGGVSAAATTAEATSSSITGQVFALLDPGESSSSMNQYAARSNVDGLAYRALWKAIEPTQGVYNWTSLDAAISAVVAQNKYLTVHIGASGGAWPQWVQTAGAQTYTYTGPQGSVTDLVPWDAIYSARFSNFVSALANHLQSSGAMARIRAVSVGAPVSEMSLAGCFNGSMGGLAYSRTSYLQAWKDSVAAYASVFTSTPLFVSAPVNMICAPDGDGKNFYTELMNYAISINGHAAIFAADLNALGSSRMAQVDSSIGTQLTTNFQMIWSANPDPQNRMQGSLQNAVCKGLGYGAIYFEIYKSDIASTDSAIQAAITTARTGQGCP